MTHAAEYDTQLVESHYHFHWEWEAGWVSQGTSAGAGAVSVCEQLLNEKE